MNREEILVYIKELPPSPGCYLYSDASGEVIYVGKAKNLRRRVSSYFQKEHTNERIRRLVSRIADINYYVVSTEADALILENNLIKKHQPRYNALLKDAKDFLRIVRTDEPYPRFVLSRSPKTRNKTFGPFFGSGAAHELMRLIAQVYRIRTCSLKLPAQIPSDSPFRRCLKYDIKLCDAPCVNLISRSDYLNNVEQATLLLRGDVDSAIAYEQKEMDRQSALWNFEWAEVHRRRIELLHGFRSKHTVAPYITHDVAIFSYHHTAELLFVNLTYLHRGSVQYMQNLRMDAPGGEDLQDLFATAAWELIKRTGADPKEIILPEPLSWLGGWAAGRQVTIPEIGDKRKLLDLSERNARQFAVDYFSKRSLFATDEDGRMRLLRQIQSDLGLNRLPVMMECFDNSNIQGSDPVSSCVVFKNARPLKSAYRKFHVKTVVGADDFATMREVVYRRYRRLVDENKPLPQVIIIDGGKGQLRAAYETLQELGLDDKIEIRGLAKRLEEIFLPGDPDPIIIPKTSPSLKIIQQIRDEAHRFGITFHRDTRSKRQTRSLLLDIPGVGEKTQAALLKQFHSVKRLTQASRDEIAAVVGLAKAALVYARLHPDEQKVEANDMFHRVEANDMFHEEQFTPPSLPDTNNHHK